MAKKNATDLQGLESVNSNENVIAETISKFSTVSPAILAKLDEITKDADIIGTKYSNFKEETEESTHEGLNYLEAFGVNPLAIALARFWHNREVWKQVRELVRQEAELQGMGQFEYEQNFLRESYRVFDLLKDGISRLNYGFNYMKPREGQSEKREQMIPISINGTQYMIGKNTLNTLKETFQGDKDQLREELLKVAKPVTEVSEEF